MVYNNNKKGAQGIGTLIIFIALILVAAVAAGVLISTVSNLQGKAETTGSEIQQRLATGFTVIQVGANGTSDGGINTTDRFDIRLQLSPGSDPIKLEDITLAQVTQGGSDPFTYQNAAPSTSTFNVTVVRGNVSDGYVNGDDVVTVEMLSAQDIGENEEFEITLFPGAGSAQRVALVTPPAMVNAYTVLK